MLRNSVKPSSNSNAPPPLRRKLSLLRFSTRGRKAVSIRLFVSLSLLVLIIFSAVLIDASYKQFIPGSWKSPLTNAGYFILGFLLIIPILNRLLFSIEHWSSRRYLHQLSTNEKAALSRFIAEARMIDVPLDYPSASVQQLLNAGIINPGSGMLYPKSDLNPNPYAYFTMPSWIYQYLSKNPELVEAQGKKMENAL